MPAKTKKIETVKHSSSYWETFRGYCEALIVNGNGNTQYLLHRYYEHHVPLHKLKDLNREDVDYGEDKFEISGIVGRVSGTHEIIIFENLDDMLREFPGTNLETWKKCDDTSLINTNEFRLTNGTAKPKLNYIINEDLYFNHYERRFNRGKQKTFILYPKE